jgi:hypothetical protein
MAIVSGFANRQPLSAAITPVAIEESSIATMTPQAKAAAANIVRFALADFTTHSHVTIFRGQIGPRRGFDPMASRVAAADMHAIDGSVHPQRRALV